MWNSGLRIMVLSLLRCRFHSSPGELSHASGVAKQKKQTKNKPEKTKNKKTPKTYILKGIFKIISFFPHRLAKTDLLSGMASVVKIQLLFLKM